MTKPKEYILRVTCPDRFGVVAKVSTCLNESELFILESAHFGDPETNKFFMRVKVCLLYTSPSPRDATLSRMPSSA